MTKEEFRELEIILGGLQVIGLTENTNKRLEKSLQVIQRDKQLILNGVGCTFNTIKQEQALNEKYQDGFIAGVLESEK